MFTNLKLFFFINILSLMMSSSLQAQTVITTLPELAWAVRSLAPELEVYSLLEGTEDPHFIDASPSFVFKVSKSKMVVANGMALEIGWFPKVLQLAGNSSVQGGKGYCDASGMVERREVLANYDRSMGDVHPQGNPHYTLSPKQMLNVVGQISLCLKKNFNLKNLDKNLKVLREQIQATSDKLEKSLKGKRYYVYHREFNYWKSDYNIEILGSLEEIPGVLPSAQYLSKLAIKSKKDRPSKVLAALTNPVRMLNKFKELSNIPYAQLRLHPKRDQSYNEFIEKLIAKISK